MTSMPVPIYVVIFLWKIPGHHFISVKKLFSNDWVLFLKREGKVRGIAMKESGNDYVLCGISYWSQKD